MYNLANQDITTKNETNVPCTRSNHMHMMLTKKSMLVKNSSTTSIEIHARSETPASRALCMQGTLLCMWPWCYPPTKPLQWLEALWRHDERVPRGIGCFWHRITILLTPSFIKTLFRREQYTFIIFLSGYNISLCATWNLSYQVTFLITYQ